MTRWNLQKVAVVCKQLDCGSIVSMEVKETSQNTYMWTISDKCFGSSQNCPSEVGSTKLVITCSGKLISDTLSANNGM